MAARPISHVGHYIPGTAVPRPGGPTHQETGVDLLLHGQPLEQAHTGALHGTGVADGFTVTATLGSSGVLVGPGVAIDPTGRHVVLAADGYAQLATQPGPATPPTPVAAEGVAVPTTDLSGDVLLTAQWRESVVDPPPAGSPVAFVTAHTPWLRVVPAADPADPDRIVLAALTLGAGGTVTAVGAAGRPGPPVPTVGGLTFAQVGPTTGPDGSARVAGVPGPRLSVRGDGGLAAGPVAVPDALRVSGGGPVGVGAEPAAGERLTVGGALGVAGAARVEGGGLFSGVTVGTHGREVSYAPYQYETVGVDRAAFNLRLQSPNVIAFHTGNQPTQPRMILGADGTLSLASTLLVGGALSVAGDVRVNGRAALRGNDGFLRLNEDLQFANGVYTRALLSAASLNIGGVGGWRDPGPGRAEIAGSLGVAGRPAAPPPWSGGGVVTWDLFAAGAVYVGEPLDDSPVQIWGGRVRAQSKAFDIAHPLDPGRRLVHGCLEGPELAVYYRGRGRLVGGRARVALPPYFEALTRVEGRTVQLTPIADPDGAVVALAAGPVRDGAFRVHADTAADGEFHWQVTAVRSDIDELDVEPGARPLSATRPVPGSTPGPPAAPPSPSR